jgi:hypothetical protein
VKAGGAVGSRTPDPHNAIVVLYQLSYDPNQRWRKIEAGKSFVNPRGGENPKYFR